MANSSAAPKLNIELSPFICTTCSAPLPLGEGSSVQCSFCQTSVCIPQEYIELRSLDRKTSAATHDLQDLLNQMGKPPGFFMRVWGTAAGAIIHWFLNLVFLFLEAWKFFFMIGFYLAALVEEPKLIVVGFIPPIILLVYISSFMEWTGRVLEIFIGFNPLDERLTATLLMIGIGMMIVIITSIPKILFKYFEAFATVRQHIQACMAATLPKQASGHSLCRQCGAALDYPANAYGVRCLYCHTDNLTALPSQWTARAKDVSQKRFLTVSEAIDEESQVKKKAKKDAWISLVISLILPIVFGFLGYHYQNNPKTPEVQIRDTLNHDH